MTIKRSEIETNECPLCKKRPPTVWNEMDDKEFLGYCGLHSRTERALFAPKHITRLHELAGKKDFAWSGDFASMDAGYADPLIKDARKILEETPPCVIEINFGCECGHRWSEYIEENV